MRGKVWENIKVIYSTGITPAHAGKSFLNFRRKLKDRDHPRTCGEKSAVEKIPHFCIGSPPHMRGKVYHILTTRKVKRITPAHAGKSLFLYIVKKIFKDHPRTCGEKSSQYRRKDMGRGSPPHMRGKVSKSHILAVIIRITPAHAGKS